MRKQIERREQDRALEIGVVSFAEWIAQRAVHRERPGWLHAPRDVQQKGNRYRRNPGFLDDALQKSGGLVTDRQSNPLPCPGCNPLIILALESIAWFDPSAKTRKGGYT
jgi:hypothetical protein